MQTPPANIYEWTKHWAEIEHIEIYCSHSTPSTNDFGKHHQFKNPQKAEVIYLTEQQTQGRGRYARQWASAPPGSQLLSSWVYLRHFWPQPILSPLIGLAVYEAAQATWPKLGWSLKAPNDLYLKNQKVAGLLIENLASGHNNQIVIGLGLNVFAHPEHINTATSLYQHHPQLTHVEWMSFCSRLRENHLYRLEQAQNPFLDKLTCQELMSGLNKYPHLDELYTEVLPDGSLQTKNKKLHWSEL